MSLNLVSKISLDSVEFERGIDRVHEQVMDSVKAFALGAIGVGTIEEAFRRTVETADELVNSAKNLDMTIEQVQLLKQAATNAGTEFDSLAKSISKIDAARAMALGGGSKGREYSAYFKALGINRQDLLTKSAGDLFTGQISSAVKNNNIETITQPLREILGRGAQDAIATLKTNFDELQATMTKTGAIMDTETAVKLHVLSDNFSLISRIVTAQLAPALAKLVEWALKTAAGTIGHVAGGAAIIGEGAKEAGWMKSFAAAGETLARAALNKIEGRDAKLTTEQQTKIDQKFGIDINKVAAAAKAASQPYFDISTNIDKQIADGVQALKNPKPDFNKTAGDERRAMGGERAHADSLISVGNYLGRNSGAISGVQFAQQTATNTAKANVLLEKIVTNLSKPWNNSKYSIQNPLDMGGITWPNP